MRFYFFLLLIIVFAFSACTKNVVTNQASASAKRFPIKGIVVSVNKAAKKAKIDHEKVEGYMDAMTMEFPIHADWIWDELTPGAEIKGDLVVDSAGKEAFWIENIGISAAVKPGQVAPPVNQNFAQTGLEVPDFSLTNQDGKKIAINDFRGKALAITFIYSSCPLPDFCILMSRNFSDAANVINKDEAKKKKISLLSISFDPANDTPAKLRSYGLGYLGKGSTDLGVWQLAVGKDEEIRKIADFFGLRYEVDANDKTQINHSLRTAVISADGKVTKIFPGNEWTPDQLLRELETAENK